MFVNPLKYSQRMNYSQKSDTSPFSMRMKICLLCLKNPPLHENQEIKESKSWYCHDALKLHYQLSSFRSTKIA